MLPKLHPNGAVRSLAFDRAIISMYHIDWVIGTKYDKVRIGMIVRRSEDGAGQMVMGERRS